MNGEAAPLALMVLNNTPKTAKKPTLRLPLAGLWRQSICECAGLTFL
jgi:hypothetical protein